MSQRHPGSRRTSRSNDYSGDPDDLFVARTLQFSNWAQQNQQLLTVLAVVAVVAFAGLVYYGNFKRTQNQAAGGELEAIHNTIAMQDREGAKADLARFIQQRGGTPYAGEARLLLGELYLETGAPEQAIAVLEPMARSPREPIEFQAATLLAASFEQEGRADDAVRVYLAIADRSDLAFQVRDALASAARVRAGQGRAEDAVTLYERLLANLEENDETRGIYEMRAAELRQGA